MRQVQPGLSLRRPTPVVLATLVGLLILWIASALTFRFVPAGREIYAQLVLDPAAVVHELKLWQLFTYALLHSLLTPTHLLFNLLGLYFFGPDLEVRWGPRRFVLFMVLTALAGGLFATVAWALGLSSGAVVGASAVVLGLIVAWGLTFPDRTVLLFFVLPLRGIHLVWLSVAFNVLSALSLGAVSAAAHFGGMAMGAVLTLGLWRSNKLKLWWDQLLVKLRIRKAPRLHVVPKPRGPERYNIH